MSREADATKRRRTVLGRVYSFRDLFVLAFMLMTWSTKRLIHRLCFCLSWPEEKSTTVIVLVLDNGINAIIRSPEELKGIIPAISARLRQHL